MVTLARCCATAATATTASTIPYKRLHRFTSKEKKDRSQQRAGDREEQEEDCDVDADCSVSSMQIRREDDAPRVSRAFSLKAERRDCRDTVVLKVAIVGDCESGKTCLVRKYVGSESNISNESGIVLQEKSLRIKNANILFSIWELAGSKQFHGLLPKVCEGAAALVIMFDLTRRSTLNSVKEWFVRARHCNKFAIPVLVGTKYDEFIDLPQDIQMALTKQAMFYAESMGASLFFSSTTHNINVHKIFKIIVAKIFDLQCNISRNYNPGEPIVAY